MATFRKPRWRDPRLGVGILLVALSVALGGWVFAKADQTQPVYVAASTIAVGDSLAEADLVVTDVNLAGAHQHYLNPSTVTELYSDGAEHVFTQPIPAGELVPLRAVGSAAALEYRPLSISVTTPAPLAVGDVADLWVVARDIAGREQQEPEQVATGLHVRGIDDDTTIFASGASQVVQVLVPEAEVGKVLGALAIMGQVTLVPHLGR